VRIGDRQLDATQNASFRKTQNGSAWSIRDPVNVKGSKDRLDRASFGITEKTLHHGTIASGGPCAAQVVEAARNAMARALNSGH
jgi:hypothetical protein